MIVCALGEQMGNCALEVFVVLLDSTGVNHFMKQRYPDVVAYRHWSLELIRIPSLTVTPPFEIFAAQASSMQIPANSRGISQNSHTNAGEIGGSELLNYFALNMSYILGSLSFQSNTLTAMSICSKISFCSSVMRKG